MGNHQISRGARALSILGALALGVIAAATADARAGAPWSSSHANRSPEFVPGEVIVGYEPGAVGRGRSAVRDSGQVQAARPLGIARLDLVALRPGKSVRAAVRRLERKPGVAYAEPNYVRELQAIPNDPLFGRLWGLHNPGGAGARRNADIDAPEAWDITLGEGSIVAVLDTGITYEHEDLVGQIYLNPGETGAGRENNGIDDDGNGFVDDWRGWDFGGADGPEGDDRTGPDNDPRDYYGHGTHVAGTIAAAANNGVGIAGVAPGAKVLPIRLGDYDLNVARSVRGIKYAHAMGADVVNMSYGGWGPSQAELDAIRAASDTVFAISAGNYRTNVDAARFYPCSYPARNIICVAASNPRDQLAGFSSYGRAQVDIAAPGAKILSAAWQPWFTRVFHDNFKERLVPTWRRAGRGNTWGRERVRKPRRFGPPKRDIALSDSPGKPYRNKANSRLTARPVALPGKDCALYYWIHGRSERNRDRLLVEARAGGRDWEQVASYSGRVVRTAAEIDLSAYDGAPAFQFRFRLRTDDSVRDKGFVIDNVAIDCGADYLRASGTSMAAPHVAGAAALLHAHKPALSPFEIRATLVGSADRRPAFRKTTTARGRLNAAAALTYTDTQAPRTRVREVVRVGKRRALIKLAANEIVSRFECRLDDGPFERCGNSFKTGALSKGTHVFRARAVDAFGNVDPTPALKRVRIR